MESKEYRMGESQQRGSATKTETAHIDDKRRVKMTVRERQEVSTIHASTLIQQRQRYHKEKADDLR